jgi:hypothetical protein
VGIQETKQEEFSVNLLDKISWKKTVLLELVTFQRGCRGGGEILMGVNNDVFEV